MSKNYDWQAIDIVVPTFAPRVVLLQQKNQYLAEGFSFG